MVFRFGLLILLLAALAGCGSSNSSSPPPNPTSAPAQNHVHSVVVMPTNASTLYMGAHYRLYKSRDGGKTWQPLTNQMMLSMAIDSAHPSILYAISSKRGMERSTDGGGHWSSATSGLPSGEITGVTFDNTTQSAIAYGLGVYRSQGATWRRIMASRSVHSVAVGTDGTLYAAADTGMFVSHDGGGHWRSATSIGNEPVLQVAASGSSAYAVGAIGLFKTSNNGTKWKLLTKVPGAVEFIGVSPSNPNEVFGEIATQGFYASYDGGLTWHAANAGITDHNFAASVIRVAPSSPQTVYTGAWGIHFYVSHDAGRHWTKTATLTR